MAIVAALLCRSQATQRFPDRFRALDDDFLGAQQGFEGSRRSSS
jgi:hypothetical protein